MDRSIPSEDFIEVHWAIEAGVVLYGKKTGRSNSGSSPIKVYFDGEAPEITPSITVGGIAIFPGIDGNYYFDPDLYDSTTEVVFSYSAQDQGSFPSGLHSTPFSHQIMGSGWSTYTSGSSGNYSLTYTLEDLFPQGSAPYLDIEVKARDRLNQASDPVQIRLIQDSMPPTFSISDDVLITIEPIEPVVAGSPPSHHLYSLIVFPNDGEMGSGVFNGELSGASIEIPRDFFDEAISQIYLGNINYQDSQKVELSLDQAVVTHPTLGDTEGYKVEMLLNAGFFTDVGIRVSDNVGNISESASLQVIAPTIPYADESSIEVVIDADPMGTQEVSLSFDAILLDMPGWGFDSFTINLEDGSEIPVLAEHVESKQEITNSLSANFAFSVPLGITANDLDSGIHFNGIHGIFNFTGKYSLPSMESVDGTEASIWMDPVDIYISNIALNKASNGFDLSVYRNGRAAVFEAGIDADDLLGIGDSVEPMYYNNNLIITLENTAGDVATDGQGYLTIPLDAQGDPLILVAYNGSLSSGIAVEGAWYDPEDLQHPNPVPLAQPEVGAAVYALILNESYDHVLLIESFNEFNPVTFNIDDFVGLPPNLAAYNFLPLRVVQDTVLPNETLSISGTQNAIVGADENDLTIEMPVTGLTASFDVIVSENLDVVTEGLSNVRLMEIVDPITATPDENELMFFDGEKYVLNTEVYLDMLESGNFDQIYLDILPNLESAGTGDADPIRFAFQDPESFRDTETVKHLALVFEDEAGNIRSEIREVLIDGKAPLLFPNSGGLVKVSKTVTDAIVYQVSLGPDNIVETIILELPDYSDESMLLGLQNNLYDYVVIDSLYTADLPGGYLINSDFDEINHRFVISLPDPLTRQSNEELSFSFVLRDPVGNESTQWVTLFSPAFFQDEESASLLFSDQPDVRYDDGDQDFQMVEFTWDMDPGLDGVLYRVNGEEETPLAGFSDSGISPHEERSYVLRLRNGSGYVGTSAEAEYRFERTAMNAEPQIVEGFAFIGDYGDASTVVGPGTELSQNIYDADGDQLELIIYIDGVEAPVIDGSVNPGFQTKRLAGLLNFTLLDEGEHTVKIQVKDPWTDPEEYVLPDWDTGDWDFASEIILDKTPPVIDSVTPVISGESARYSDDAYELRLGDAYTDIASARILSVNGAANTDVLIEAVPGQPGAFVLTNLPEGIDQEIVLELEDSVGNTGNTYGILTSVDRSDPLVSAASFDAPDHLGSYYFPSPNIPLVIEWSDAAGGSGPAVVELELDDGTGERIVRKAVGNSWSVVDSDILRTVISVDEILPAAIAGYTARLRIIDGAGNYSTWHNLAGELSISDSVPSVRTVLTGATPANGLFIITSASGFGPDVDSAIPIIRSEISVYDEYAALVLSDPTDIADLISSLDEGRIYSMVSSVTDASGNEATSAAVPFLIDTSAPSLSAFAFVNPEQRVSGGRLAFSVNAVDNQSGMDRIRIWVGTAGDQLSDPSISPWMTGADTSGLIELAYVSPSQVYSLPIPESASGDFLVRVELIDQAGHSSGLLAPGAATFTLGADNQRLVVNETKTYYAAGEDVSAGWYYAGPDMLNFEYRLVEGAANAGFTAWYPVTGNWVSYSSTELLTPGTVYRFQFRGHPADGGAPIVRTSPGFYVDDAAPTLAGSSVAGYSDGYGILVDWSAIENGSGIRRAEVEFGALMRSPDGTIVLDDGEPVARIIHSERFSAGTAVFSGRISIPEDSLETNNIRSGDPISVRITIEDIAGNVASYPLGVSIYDRSIPSGLKVADQGDFINTAKTPMQFTWSASSIKSVSPLTGAEYQLIASSSAPAAGAWVELDSQTLEAGFIEVDVAGYGLSGGEQVYLYIRIRNEAGATGQFSSDGIVVDFTAPDIPTAYIAQTNPGTRVSLIDDAGYALNVLSHDDESEITGFAYQKLIFTDGSWEAQGEVVQTGVSTGYIDIIDGDAMADGTLFAYKVWAVNGADTRSLEYVTQPVTFDSRQPAISRMNFTQNQDTLLATWETDDSGIGADRIAITLREDGATIYENTVSSSPGILLIDESLIGRTLLDGSEYELSAVPVAATGAEGATAVALIELDRTPPEIDDFEYDRFVSGVLTGELGASDHSGIGELRYRVGLVGDPEYFTGDWLLLNRGMSSADIAYDFAGENPETGEQVNHGDGLIISVQARDRRGNWSPVTVSDVIRVDETGPDLFGIAQDRGASVEGFQWENTGAYILDGEYVQGLSFVTVDEESGVVGYKYVILPSGEIPVDESPWSALLPIQDQKYFYLPTDVSAENLRSLLPMGDGDSMTVYIKAINRAGVYSLAVASEPLLVDRQAAIVQIADGSPLPAFNGAGALDFDVEDAGEQLVIGYEIRNPQGYLVDAGDFLHPVSAGGFSIPFDPGEYPDSFGIYSYSIMAIDQGNRTRNLQGQLRYNAPPAILVPDIVYSTPGQPLALESDAIIDDDGYGLLIEIFDGEQLVHQSVIDESELDSWTPQFFHREGEFTETAYSMVITATDDLGQSASKSLSLVIRNTESGSLFADETWSYSHRITGDLLVPDGITLTIAGNTAVEVLIDPLDMDEEPAIIVDGVIDIGDGSSFTAISETVRGLWKGILVRGNANLGAITVSGAERGITLDGVDIVLDGITFENNRIGLHVLSSDANPVPTVSVSNGRFENNAWYGVKEDGTVDISLSVSGFLGNGFDYYRSDGRLLTPDQLNLLPNNQGNF
jgi:hypothetical protein